MKRKTIIRSYLINLDDYIKLEVIGQGSYGIVYKVEHKTSHQQYAAKVSLHNTEISQDKLLSRELGILMRIQAPTIIPFYGFSLKDFNNDPRVTFLMEYEEKGTLKQLIDEDRANSPPENYNNTAKQIILCGIAHGMMTLHSRSVIHRDLKPDNVLLDSNLHPYITDFGCSKFFNQQNIDTQSLTLAGTASYLAPEVINDNNYSEKSDVFSFGILMYEVITRTKAFQEVHSKKTFISFEIITKIAKGERPQFDTPIKPSLQHLIQQCWAENPQDRPSFHDIFNKLSLSLEDDDETIEPKLYDIVSNNDQSEEGTDIDWYKYCLDDVDRDKVVEYVKKITQSDKITKENLQKEIEEQAQYIALLEIQNTCTK